MRSVVMNVPESLFGGPLGLETPRYDKSYLFIIAFVLVLLSLAVIQNLLRSKHGRAITSIRDNVIGGLGAAVAQAVCQGCPVPVLNVGTEDVFGRSGKVPPLLEMYGLTPANIADKAKKAIALKK